MEESGQVERTTTRVGRNGVRQSVKKKVRQETPEEAAAAARAQMERCGALHHQGHRVGRNGWATLRGPPPRLRR